MKLTLKNVCKVKEASIELNGLTVIAGENDSGKSTIGKTLFSVVKALLNADGILPNTKKRLDKLVKTLYTRNGSMQGSFALPSNKFLQKVMAISSQEDILDFYEKIKSDIDKLEATPRIKTLMIRDLQKILICIKDKDNPAAGLLVEIQNLIESEFMNKVCSFNTQDSLIEFSMDENNKNKVSIEIADDVVKSVDFEGNFVADATYVESPLYVHLLDSFLYSSAYILRSARTSPLRPMVPAHVKDLTDKIFDLRLVQKKEPQNKLIESLMGITSGHFVYDDQRRNLIFEKNGVPLSPINVASGIKSFGLIQMLLELDAINPNKILIWDEPENHLHPQWQIEFSKVMVQLAEVGIPIVISTHSPYFIQGIRYSSTQKSIDKYVNYYLNETCEDGRSVFQDVTNDLNQVFYKLAKPLNDIVNID